MDKRQALLNGDILNFKENDNKASYAVAEEIGRGGSCIVYNGYYKTNTGNKKEVRIKEFYPAGLHISRKDGFLTADDKFRNAFEKRKKLFKETFKDTNGLFSVKDLTNSIVNTIDIYEKNNTLYVVTALTNGSTLEEAAGRLSLNEMITAALSTAEVIKHIHEAGYLYLDLKPSNVFVFPETSELVQLFDFDTLTPTDKNKNSRRISYTRGFAPVELAAGRFSDTGIWTDIYETGALLYWMITGRTPDTAGPDELARTDIFGCETLSDRFYRAAGKYFKGTLTAYYKDRFKTDDEGISLLCEMKEYSDPRKEYIISSYIENPFVFTGRENDLKKFGEFINQNTAERHIKCTVNGIGGIGKSSFVSKYISGCRDKYDSVLWLSYSGSIKEMLADDLAVRISTVTRDQEETKKEYYKRKLIKLKDICSSQNVLIITDDFYSRKGEDLSDLFSLGADLIFITREADPALDLPMFRLGPVSDTSGLFMAYLGRKIKKEEQRYLYEMISHFYGHTLTIRITACQVREGRLSLAEASELAVKYDLPAVSAQKDKVIFHGKILSLLSDILDLSGLSAEKRSVLKELSCVEMPGILQKDMKAFSGSDAAGLINLGWVEVHGKYLSLHPLIREVVKRWEYTSEIKKNISVFLTNIAAETDRVKALYERTDKYNADIGITKEREVYNIKSESSAGYMHTAERVIYLYRLTDGILRNCHIETIEQRALIYSCIQIMPQDEEKKMLHYCLYLLENGNRHGNRLSAERVLNLRYQRAYVYDQQGYPEKAYNEIKKAFPSVIKSRDMMLISEYYWELSSEMCETGNYGRTIRYLRMSEKFAGLSGGRKGARQLALCNIREAHWLMQVFSSVESGRIWKLIKKCGNIIKKYGMTDDIDLMSSYFSDKAFCLALFGNQNEELRKRAVILMEKGISYIERQCTSDLFHIENIELQRFTVYFCLKDKKSALKALDDGEKLCMKHRDEEPYRREHEMLQDQRKILYDF